jgi:hypothetical protein
MRMVRQYPRYVYALFGGEAELGDDGVYRQTVAEWRLVSMGRDETNGKGSEVSTADGETIKFAATVYLPLSCKHISEGTPVVISTRQLTDIELSQAKELMSDGTVTIVSQCYRFSRGQLNVRMWI